MDLIATLDQLINGWCERRALRPLQYLFRSYPGPLLHTDQFRELHDALLDVKGMCREDLTTEELRNIIAAISHIEDRLP